MPETIKLYFKEAGFMDHLTSKNLYKTLQSNNSDLKQYLNLAPDLNQVKQNHAANGKSSSLKILFKRSLPNNSSSLPN